MTALTIALGWLTASLAAAVALTLAAVWLQARRLRSQLRAIDALADAVIKRDRTIEDLRRDLTSVLDERFAH